MPLRRIYRYLLTCNHLIYCSIALLTSHSRRVRLTPRSTASSSTSPTAATPDLSRCRTGSPLPTSSPNPTLSMKLPSASLTETTPAASTTPPYSTVPRLPRHLPNLTWITRSSRNSSKTCKANTSVTPSAASTPAAISMATCRLMICNPPSPIPPATSCRIMSWTICNRSPTRERRRKYRLPAFVPLRTSCRSWI